jgi:LPS export ABC transporter permease LptG
LGCLHARWEVGGVKRLDRYVIKELVIPFVIGTVAVVLMFQANLLIFLFKSFSLSAIPPLAIGKLIFYKTPFFLNMTLPVGIALATSLALSRLTRETELTAMRAAGTSILRVLYPVSLFGLVVGVGNYFLAEKVMPPAEKEATRLNMQLMILGAAPEFKSDVFIHLGNYSANFGTVSRGPGGSLGLNDIILIERPKPYEETVYTAKEGTYVNGVWTIKNALIRYFANDDLYQLKPQNLVINQRINVNDLYTSAQPTEMTVEQLREAIRTGKEQRSDTTSLEVSYHTRFSVPAACYVFAIVGPVFAIWLGRSGGFVGVLLSILMVLLYYNVFVISTEILGRNRWVTPVLAAWLPNILFIAFGVLGIRRLE